MRRSAAYVLFLCAVVASPGGPARGSTPDPAPLSEAVGAEIGASERDAYRLFPDAGAFEFARIYPRGSGYRVEYGERSASGIRKRSRSISADAFEQTRWHVAFAEAYRDTERSDPGSTEEAWLLRRLALRYASRARYETAYLLAEDLRTGFPETEPGRWAAAAPRMESLALRRSALIWPGTLIDQSGRTDLLVFSGYYGLWLGIAVPAAFEAEDAQAYAAGLLLAPTASVLLASVATRGADISDAQATLISLGGHLGTWQGIGWAAMGDADGNAAVGWGVGAGLAGIAAAVPFGHSARFTEGHAAITSSAMYWGGWFGAVIGILADHDETQDHGVLPDMLVGSDAAVLGAAIVARGARLSEGRMRLINLAGVLGTAFGGGMALLIETDDEKAAFALLGAGGVGGLLAGTRLTREHDRGKDLAAGSPGGRSVTPVLSLRRGTTGVVPALGVRLGF